MTSVGEHQTTLLQSFQDMGYEQGEEVHRWALGLKGMVFEGRVCLDADEYSKGTRKCLAKAALRQLYSGNGKGAFIEILLDSSSCDFSI